VSWSWGPFLWGARRDLWVFGSSFALPLLLVAGAALSGAPHRELPEWAFLAFVVGVDVAHVYATLFRSYLDRAELACHRLRYWSIPIVAYVLAALCWQRSPLFCFRVLAYLAVWHFVRQQAGWVALYRARAGDRSLRSRAVDGLAIYAATLFPLFSWHVAPESRRFAWFMAGDFVDAAALASWLPVARAAWLLALALFALEQLRKLAFERRVELGKLVLVVGTALTWYVGIVHTNGDFEFTVTNVLPHGIPYLALLYFYARARQAEAPRVLASRVMVGGVAAFLGSCVALAWFEEAAWARWVFHEHSGIFGQGSELGSLLTSLLAPLLVVPQATHYWLDGLLWRRRATAERPAQRAALGFDAAFAPGAAAANRLGRVVESRTLS
jgi:hypothetical protein